MNRIKPLFSLEGKVAIVTGASKGIGEAMARGMAEHGAKVVISSRKQDAVDAVVAHCEVVHRHVVPGHWVGTEVRNHTLTVLPLTALREMRWAALRVPWLGTSTATTSAWSALHSTVDVVDVAHVVKVDGVDVVAVVAM